MLKNIRHLYRRFSGAYRRHGMLNLPRAIIRRVQHRRDYQSWSRARDKSLDSSRLVFIEEISAWPIKPLISVVMPTWNTDPIWLERAVASVRNQVYEKWELCIADDASSNSETVSALKEFAKSDPRIRVIFREVNGHISEASNSALEMAKGDYVALLDHDDELHPYALYFVAKEINLCPDAIVIYSDEDKINAAGHRFDPYFKSDWNSDLFYAQNMVSHLGVFRCAEMRSVGGFRKGYEGSQDYDLALRITGRISSKQIRHIPEVLYHWRTIPGSTAVAPGEKNYASHAADRALKDALSTKNISAKVLPAWGSFKRVKYLTPECSSRVCLVVWAVHKEVDLHHWEHRYREFADRSGYKVEIRIGRIQSLDRPMTYIEEAIGDSKADVFLVLEAGYVPENDEWLDELVTQALRSEIGAVGGKLLTLDGKIMLGGLILGIGSSRCGCVSSSAFYLQEASLPGQMGRAQLTQCFSALGLSCIAFSREAYVGVGGFNFQEFSAPVISLDYCLRQWDCGNKIIWTPYAVFRYEGKTPAINYGPGSVCGPKRETGLILSTWPTKFAKDPFYHPKLNRHIADFTLG